MTDSFPNYNNEITFSDSTPNLSEIDDDLVSEKVNILANGIYQEFENLIKLHGQGTVDGLMPLIVTILETMDKLYTCKDNLSLQIDLIKEDQNQLYTQYEREKFARKSAEQEINRIEIHFEEEIQNLENRIEVLESNSKLSEMKLKNCRDLISRHEEKEVDMRKEFNTLQQRYSDLLKSKADHKIRNNYEVSSSCQSPQLSVKPKPERNLKMSASTGVNMCKLDPILVLDKTDSRMGDLLQNQIGEINELSLKDELDEECYTEKEIVSISLNQHMNDENAVLEFDMTDENFEDECQVDSDEHIENGDLCVEDDFDYLGMIKEIEFLLKENQDLVETKNALNIVKDDLITKLDELTGELIILREDLKNSNTLKRKYRAQVQELERNLNNTIHRLKEKEEKLLQFVEEDNLIECSVDQNGVLTRTIITKAEVSRILMERNKFKEELLELRETMRYQMTAVIKKNERAKKGTLLNLFGSLISSATTFTTEALIGSGQEMTIAQVNRNFTTISDETGASIPLPNLSNSTNRKLPTPGIAMRVLNPLFNPLQEDTHAMVNLVPLDEIKNTSPRRKNYDQKSF